MLRFRRIDHQAIHEDFRKIISPDRENENEYKAKIAYDTLRTIVIP